MAQGDVTGETASSATSPAARRTKSGSWSARTPATARCLPAPGTRRTRKGHPQAFKSVAVGRTLTEYQIIYITKGRGVFETEPENARRGPGDRHDRFSRASAITTSPEFDVGWTEYWVGFKGPYADTLREQGFLSPPQAAVRGGAAEQPPRHLRADLRARPEPAAPLPGQGELARAHPHRRGPRP